MIVFDMSELVSEALYYTVSSSPTQFFRLKKNAIKKKNALTLLRANTITYCLQLILDKHSSVSGTCVMSGSLSVVNDNE